MSRRHKHVTKNHEITEKLEIGSEIAKKSKSRPQGSDVTYGPHQCIQLPPNRGGCAENVKKGFEIVFMENCS